jgi:hypothetical protein
VRKIGYQALGFGVWQGAKWFLRHREAPRKIALGSVVVAVVAALVFAGRKASTD